MNYFKILGLGAAMTLSVGAFAQEQSTTAASNPSARPIAESDMMYRKTVWRTIDLREKQNKPLFADGRQITKVIIDAVKRGELPIYKNDSLTTTLTQQEFNTNMVMPEEGGGMTEEERALGFDEPAANDAWGDAAPQDAAVVTGPAEFFPKDLYQMELKEDAIFDKKRSRMYHDIKAITLVVPASLKSNVKGRDIPVGTFKYSDLVKVFRDHPTEALWFNPQNDAQHKNLADAFDLRLFSSFITKVSNPDNSSLEDIYGGPQQGILAAQTTAEQMIEYEYNLWSF
ncbi:gliding motility protein GldN [Adhaeribacter sp. BT258]|uniref:Gliding motility protein GldN n=1 Tax=Adhaeribacter terrigena TaxID=2793070 RepID=A0ABS1C4F7_9BACT|nr:gliding motility protein GldN [Adhaeribacter terrigena]MBK0404278.1 gliding motility protein GldN [Adhaeribacter terrigena]